ncbi:MAG: metallophosphoesterase [Pseudomonadota bacterium]
MFRLAHLSDVHLAPLPRAKPVQLLNKRLVGYLNWQLNRRGEMQSEVLQGLIDCIKGLDVDHVALPGDLVNLALPAEIIRMKSWLLEFGAPEWISVVPGNHDTYVPGALRACRAAWGPYMVGDDEEKTAFPYLRRRGNISLIGVNSGIATPPFIAQGRFGRRQRNKTRALLDEAALRGDFRVVMIHHPPFPNATYWHKRLLGERRFRAMIADVGAELILHGHTHLDTQMTIAKPNGTVPVIGVPSASQSLPAGPGELAHKPASRFNLFTIEGEPGHWSCVMEEYGYKSDNPGVNRMSRRVLMAS